MTNLTAGQIQLAYKTLWTKFIDAANAQTLEAKINSPGGVVEAGGPQGPRVSALVYLPRWPYKATSKKQIDIVVRVSEQFSKSGGSIDKSTTQVGYFSRTDHGDILKPLLQLHYDFESPPQSAHPVFHAQLGETDWPLAELKKLGFPGGSTSDAASSYKNARIPTAFMGFGQILLALAADHLKPQHYESVLEAVRSNNSSKWSAVCDGLRKSLDKGGYLHAHHWYAPSVRH